MENPLVPLLVALGIGLVGAPAAAAAQGHLDGAAARVPLENYFKGHPFKVFFADRHAQPK